MTFARALEQSAAENALPVEFFARVIWQESRFDAKAISLASEPGLVFLPFFEFARQLLNTRLNVTHHQAPIFASTLCSLLVDRLADPFKSLDFVPKIIVDRLLG
jgi:hypothetical protein